MEAILSALTRIDWLIGTTVAVLVFCGLCGGLLLLNQWRDWWMSTRRHVEMMAIATARAEEARGDAEEKITSMRAAMERRIQEYREDHALRATQIRADSQAELDRLIKFADALQRDVESWRTAWNLADQANREEDDARWDEIKAALSVMQRVVLEAQRQAAIARGELEMGSGDGRGERSHVR